MSFEQGSAPADETLPSFREVTISNFEVLTAMDALRLLDQARTAVVEAEAEKFELIRRNRELNQVQQDAERAIPLLEAVLRRSSEDSSL